MQVYTSCRLAFSWYPVQLSGTDKLACSFANLQGAHAPAALLAGVSLSSFSAMSTSSSGRSMDMEAGRLDAEAEPTVSFHVLILVKFVQSLKQPARS